MADIRFNSALVLAAGGRSIVLDPHAGHGATSVDSSFLLTVPEAARLLRISRNLTYELIRQKALPHVRLGRRILVPRQGLVNWIARESGLLLTPSPVLSLPAQSR